MTSVTYIQTFLKNSDNKALITEILTEKEARYALLKTKWGNYTQEEILKDLGVCEVSISLCYDLYIEKEEMQQLEKTINRLKYQLDLAQGKRRSNKDWEEQYRYATNVITVDEVFEKVLGVTQFHKNIKCPFHGEDKSPSLHVYSKDNFWICFGCQRKGGPVEFIMEYNQCDFKEAVRIINNLR